METKTVRLMATFIARHDKVEELSSVLRQLVEPTRAEAGCLRYELWQSEEDAAEFRFVEEWASEEDLTTHLQTPHIKRARARYPGLLAGEPDLRMYRFLG